MEFDLKPRQAGGGTVQFTTTGWRLEMPAGQKRSYRLAQLDDYSNVPRKLFKHTPPWTFSLRARVSDVDLPGTWGFGLWNDPFGFSIGLGGEPGQLPALPQAAWFMHASPPNWLSVSDSYQIPANGFFAGTFRSLTIPSLLLAPGLLTVPLSTIRPISRLLRKLAAHLVHQDAARVDVEVTQWHVYSISWLADSCRFYIDGNVLLQTPCSPRPPLGLVLWIDNQFATWTPKGPLGYGILENPPAWLEFEGLSSRQI